MIEVTTETLPQAERFPFWRELISGNFQEADLRMSREESGSFSGHMTIRPFGDFELIDSQSSPHMTVQSKDYVSHVDDGYLWLYHQMESREVCTFDSVDDVALNPGDMYLYHPVLPCTLRPIDSLPSRTMVFRFHKRSIAGLSGRLPAYLPTRKVSGEDGVTRLLASYVRTLAEELPRLDPEDAEAAIRAFYGLATAAYGTVHPDCESVADATNLGRINMAGRIIARMSHNPALAPEMVARAMNISERSLHRAYELSGESFASALRSHRLGQCKTALRNPMAAGRLIATIAFDCGFESLATFNRQFQAAFGMSPSEWRRRAQ